MKPFKSGRIAGVFRSLRKEGRCGLIAYLTCGDPSVEVTIQVVEELSKNGADLIELGVPFSDPIADGPVIQGSSSRALRQGTSVRDVLEAARRIREKSESPLIVFSYLNPLLRYGMEPFCADAARAGVDGVLITDLPPESAGLWLEAAKRNGLRMSFLVAPTTSMKRLRLIDRAADGFVYCLSTSGVTGERRDLDPALLTRLAEIRKTILNPLVVGFGISSAEHYRALAPHCDAVVVGSAIVRAIAGAAPGKEAAAAVTVVREILG